MEGQVHMKHVTGEFFPTTLVLNSETNRMTWIKQDGKSEGEYIIQPPVTVKERIGQARKFCFELLHPVSVFILKHVSIVSFLEIDHEKKFYIFCS